MLLQPCCSKLMEGVINRLGRGCAFNAVAGIVLLYVTSVILSNHHCCRPVRFFFSDQYRHHLPPAVHPCSSTVSLGSSTTNLSHIVFGVASSANTWRSRGTYIDLWWRPNKTRGFVWLDRAPTEYPWPATSPPFRVSMDTGRFKVYEHHAMPFAVRMALVISEAFRVRMDDARWFVMADDDTVLFVDNLVQVLADYDHRGYFYIGGISECVSQNFEHSFGMAFGGAGYAISYPLAKELSRILDGCLRRYPNLYGSDHVIQSCISELGVSLTRLAGFHQFDLHGDVSGLLSAHPQAPLLSFHHLDFVDPIFPAMTRLESLRHLMKASYADSSHLLQQTICYDRRTNWSYSISWGYSVHIYEKIQSPRILQTPMQTFRPWKNSARPPFMFNVRPVSRDPCEAPHIFYFDSVVKNTLSHDRMIITSYVRRNPRQLQACSNNSADAIFRIGVHSSAERLKWVGSRRECCDVNPSRDINATEIRIRTCMDNEPLELIVPHRDF